MQITVKQMNKEEMRSMLDAGKVVNRLPEKMLKDIKKLDFKITYDYAIEKIYKGYPLVIEFCISDFCVYPCSKKGHWLLEKKTSCETFAQALLAVTKLQLRIENGEHWTGENN